VFLPLCGRDTSKSWTFLRYVTADNGGVVNSLLVCVKALSSFLAYRVLLANFLPFSPAISDSSNFETQLPVGYDYDLGQQWTVNLSRQTGSVSDCISLHYASKLVSVIILCIFLFLLTHVQNDCFLDPITPF
jgi:hypothetical protein